MDFVRFSNSAITPTKGTEDSAGFDVYSKENVTIPVNSIKIIRTDIGFKIPRGQITSSPVVRCTEVGGGVINADHRGPVAVIFFNFSEKSIEIENGNRFCQIVFHKTANRPVLRQVENFEHKTDRGERSF